MLMYGYKRGCDGIQCNTTAKQTLLSTQGKSYSNLCMQDHRCFNCHMAAVSGVEQKLISRAGLS